MAQSFYSKKCIEMPYILIRLYREEEISIKFIKLECSERDGVGGCPECCDEFAL